MVFYLLINLLMSRHLIMTCLGLSRPDLPHQQWLVVVWLAVVSSADGLYVVALWRGCHGTSVSAWGLFWPPKPRPCLLLQRPSGEGRVGFT
jgi:hypothetical protein